MHSRASAALLTLCLASPAAAAGGDFPFVGSYGVPDAKWDGCADARLRREGRYVTFGRGTVFVHESSCRIVSWSRSGADTYDVTEACPGSRKPVVERFRIDRETLTLRGSVYRRCPA